MVKLLPVSDQTLCKIQRETEADQTLQVVKSLILKGWPNDRSDLPLQAAPHYSLRDELTVQDGVILRGARLVIPGSLRKQNEEEISLLTHGNRIVPVTSARIHLLAWNFSRGKAVSRSM